jgi:hypothetical protein
MRATYLILVSFGTGLVLACSGSHGDGITSSSQRANEEVVDPGYSPAIAVLECVANQLKDPVGSRFWVFGPTWSTPRNGPTTLLLEGLGPEGPVIKPFSWGAFREMDEHSYFLIEYGEKAGCFDVEMAFFKNGKADVRYFSVRPGPIVDIVPFLGTTVHDW